MVQLKKMVKHTQTNSDNVYLVKLPSGERAFRMSTGFTLEALDAIAGKWLAVKRYKNTSNEWRVSILSENFKSGASDYAGGSFASSIFFDICESRYYSSTYYHCPDCGRQTNDTDHDCADRFCACGKKLKTADERAFGYCKECATRRASTWYSYHGRPARHDPNFERPHLRDSYAHLGVEWEIDSEDYFTDEDVKELSDVLNRDPFRPFFMFEHDSSIDGCEAISAPTTLKGFNNAEKVLKEAFDTARARGGIWKKKNGLHVHIDRDYFGAPASEERAKGISMLYYLINSHFDFFATISHRQSDGFYYARKKEGIKGIITASEAMRHPDHFDAVNVGNPATIEVRLFGGYIDNEQKMLAVLDIVNALARWAKESSLAQCEKATPAQIVRYINNPARVLDFVNDRIPHAFTSATANSEKTDFIKALQKRI